MSSYEATSKPSRNQLLTQLFLVVCALTFLVVLISFFVWPRATVEGRAVSPSLSYNAYQGDLAGVRYLLDKGYPIDVAAPKTPLTAAVEGKSNEVVSLLLSEGANPNLRDDNGHLPLTLASRDGSSEIVSLLLAAGANVAKKDEFGLPPLHWAAREGHLGIVELLISGGAPVNLVGPDNGTALMAAAGFGRTEVLERLLVAGADAKLKDNAGKTAAEHGELALDSETLKLLRQ